MTNWRRINRQHCRDYDTRWRAKNPLTKLASSAKYRAKNRKELSRKARIYDLKNWAAVLRRHKIWRDKNPETMAAMARNQRARRKQAPGKHTVEDIRNIWDRQQHKCAVPHCLYPISDQKGPHKYHVDHIKALMNGGSNWPKNLQILCGTHNRRKQAQDEFRWAAENGVKF
jgi:HNH endonuclease